MTIEELRELVKGLHWHLNVQVRKGQGKRFIYAKKYKGGKTLTKYICPESKLEDMTVDQVVCKLAL